MFAWFYRRQTLKYISLGISYRAKHEGILHYMRLDTICKLKVHIQINYDMDIKIIDLHFF